MLALAKQVLQESADSLQWSAKSPVMDQLKVKDRILENISLSVKKVSAAGWSTLNFCHRKFVYCQALLKLT